MISPAEYVKFKKLPTRIIIILGRL